MIEITVRDTDSEDEPERTTIENDYMIVCAGGTYVAHVQAFKNGTHVITVKRDR